MQIYSKINGTAACFLAGLVRPFPRSRLPVWRNLLKRKKSNGLSFFLAEDKAPGLDGFSRNYSKIVGKSLIPI